MLRIVVSSLLSALLLLPARPSSAALTVERPSTLITLSADLRLRTELVDWLRPRTPDLDPRYDFFASRLRLRAGAVTPWVEALIELQDTRLTAIPSAAASPATGPLGPGAVYFGHTRSSDQGETVLRRAFLRFRRRALRITLGRFDHRDGGESRPRHPQLAALQALRITERLIGPVDFTHISRSFDGGRVTWDDRNLNATAFAFVPTHGAFEISANRNQDDLWLAGASIRAKRLTGDRIPMDVRLFYIYSDDARPTPVRADNRVLEARQLDRGSTRLHTGGGHLLTLVETSAGEFDGLAWGALQGGDWGAQRHRAWAVALELGYRAPRLPGAPWLRVGWNVSSGDGNPDDPTHRTFHPLLPTTRKYARTPLFAHMNVDDRFVQVILSPHPRLTIRADYHAIRLRERDDLWYNGVGATNDDIFGYVGVRTAGERELAHTADVSISAQPYSWLKMRLFFGQVFGQAAAEHAFAGRNARYGFAEITLRY